MLHHIITRSMVVSTQVFLFKFKGNYNSSNASYMSRSLHSPCVALHHNIGHKDKLRNTAPRITEVGNSSRLRWDGHAARWTCMSPHVYGSLLEKAL